MRLKNSTHLRMVMFGASGTLWPDNTQVVYPVLKPWLDVVYRHTSDIRVDSLSVRNPETGEAEVIDMRFLPLLEFKDGYLDETIELFGYTHRLIGKVAGTTAQLETMTYCPRGKSRSPMIERYGIRYSTHHNPTPPKMVNTDPAHIMGLAFRNRR